MAAAIRNAAVWKPHPSWWMARLYLTTAFNRVFALDPETGKQRWVYDPMTEIGGDYGDGLINRGVTTWLDPAASERKTVPPANFRGHTRCATDRAR